MSLKAFMKSHLESLQSQIFTGLPAIVTDNSEYESKNIISVRPTIDMQHSDGQVSECPEIFNVPVINPSAGGGLLSFPIQIGDTVWLEFSMRNIEEWLEGDGGSVTEPTQRMHDMSDAVAIVGLYTKNSHLQPDPKDVVLKFKDNKLILKEDGNVEIHSKSKYSVYNDQEELIALLSDIVDTIGNTTVNTIFGPTPLNSKAQIMQLKTKLDTFKK
jgi:hypothetical protein